MPYITSNGEISSGQPWGLSKIIGLFWGIVNLIYVFFQTLINPGMNSRGPRYTQDYRRPGSGPPKPPRRRMGGFGNMSSLQPPPCAGSS